MSLSFVFTFVCTLTNVPFAMKNRIKVARAEVNITQGELAEKIGVTRQAVNSIELGKYIPSTLLALKMAQYFGKTVEELFMLEEGD